MMRMDIFEWTDERVKEFAKICSAGAYGEYKGCKTMDSKLARFKELNGIIKKGRVWRQGCPISSNTITPHRIKYKSRVSTKDIVQVRNKLNALINEKRKL